MVESAALEMRYTFTGIGGSNPPLSAMHRTVHGSAEHVMCMAPPPDIMHFFYVYILRSTIDKLFYIGFTDDVWQRLKQHNDGEVQSTRPRRPFELIFFEAYPNKYDALRREKYLKTSKGKTTIRTMLKEYLTQPNE